MNKERGAGKMRNGHVGINMFGFTSVASKINPFSNTHNKEAKEKR
jgi:hypothetical protein